MKRLFVAAALLLSLVAPGVVAAQQAYWVFLADKSGSEFDPYAYFDAKAIERYLQCGADLYDATNYPVSTAYEQEVAALVAEEIGASRWMNAIGVMATETQIAAIEALPYVLRVQPIDGDGMQVARYEGSALPLDGLFDKATVDGPLEAQLVRMGGKAFRDKGIDGKGVRVAVFDGGFPRVNTHAAFKHLRDGKQIVKTWNFPNKKEDVYGWNSHGTMTLSCIAGRMGSVDLGLATGAEFLLARTEVEAEPFKEEVWWQMAVEWADRNGANVISSSLGYGKERHYTKDMDGTSYVAKAGNLAARKGMLVVNSAGNEADDRQWRTIITPSDADSVLCVGGIENSLTNYNHISFSSYGPSADGRLKPNVCAFGYARTANVSSDNAYHYVHGTSFSCPLVAGFAACAWQASPGKTAMQMFDLIQRSADLYPYADYAFGYGVPQADYFCPTGPATPATPTFRFAVEDDSVRVLPTQVVKHKHLFYSYRRPDDGRLDYYGKVDVVYMDQANGIAFSKKALFNRTLTVHLGGYTDSLTLGEEEYGKYRGMSGLVFYPEVGSEAVVAGGTGRNGTLKTSNWGSNAKYRMETSFMLGLPVRTSSAEMASSVWSPEGYAGLNFMRAFGKSYSIGIGLGYGFSSYRFGNKAGSLDSLAAMDDDFRWLDAKVSKHRLDFGSLGIELFQRVRLVPLGLFGKGLHWDLGVYGNWSYSAYVLKGSHSGDIAASRTQTVRNLAMLDSYRWNYGLTTRFSYDCIGLYARYRLNDIVSKPASGQVLLPRLTIGLVLQF